MDLKKFKYHFNSSLGVLYKYYYGDITLEDITSSWEHAFENNLVPKGVKGFILDYREASFDIKIEEHTHIADFYKNNLDVFGNLKIGIITEEPNDIVIPILVESIDDGYSSQPFTTHEAALEWVLN